MILGKFIFLIFTLFVHSSCTSLSGLKKTPARESLKAPKNIIFMIVDGMGFEYVKAARIFNGQTPLAYENFPCKTRVSTCAWEGSKKGAQCSKNSSHVTDSAAGATAIATGQKVSNGVLSRQMPGTGENIETILERAKAMHKSTGIVVTKLISDATPAAFVAHAGDRKLTPDILQFMFNKTTPNVVFGADNEEHRQCAKSSLKKYEFIHKAHDLKIISDKIAQGPACEGLSCPYVYGGFGQHQMIPGFFDKESGLPLEISSEEKFSELGVPHLSQMSEAALKILSKNKNGFFLLIESSMPDMIGHHNEQFDESEQTPSAIAVLVREMMEVERTAQVLQDFLSNNPDTLIIITADHETGGLIIEDHKTDCLGQLSCLASARWTSEKYDADLKDSPARHTGADVPLYAIGQGSERFCRDNINNTDIRKLSLGL